MRTAHRTLLPLALAALLTGCSSGGRTKLVATPAPLPDALTGLALQKRLLPAIGDAQKLAFKAQAALPKGDCDVAVEIQSVSYAAGRLALALATLGPAEVKDRARGRACRELPAYRELSITGLSGPDAAVAEADRLLLTPERFLAARDVAFDLAPEAKAPVAGASAVTAAPDQERQLARQVTSWPKPLLSVHVALQAPSQKARYEGEANFSAIVGADGRLYRAEVRGGLSEAQTRAIERVLAMWRYEPARKSDGERLPARVDGRLNLRIR